MQAYTLLSADAFSRDDYSGTQKNVSSLEPDSCAFSWRNDRKLQTRIGFNTS
jgi:hypothetical protein